MLHAKAKVLQLQYESLEAEADYLEYLHEVQREAAVDLQLVARAKAARSCQNRKGGCCHPGHSTQDGSHSARCALAAQSLEQRAARGCEIVSEVSVVGRILLIFSSPPGRKSRIQSRQLIVIF